MSITRDRKFIVFECDHCHDVFETETENFADAKEKLDKEGWRTVKIQGEWRHFDERQCYFGFQDTISKRMRERK